MTPKDEDLLEDLLVHTRGKLSRAAQASSLEFDVFCSAFVERLTASVALGLAFPLEDVLEGIRGEHARLRGEESSDV